MIRLALFADGGSRGNPGPAAGGFVLYEVRTKLESTTKLDLEIWKSHLKELHGEGFYIGEDTNNQAEWQAVVRGLEYVQDNYSRDIQLFVMLDSQLVIRQLSGQYKVKKPELKPHHASSKAILDSLSSVELHHVYREFNKEADALVNQTLDALI